jgi:transposase InsO family protein
VLTEDRAGRAQATPEQRLLILDTWIRSKLSAREFAGMVGISAHSLYKWKKRFSEDGPAGLCDKPKGGRPGSRLPDATRRAIVLLKETHPDWGQDRIRDVLVRTEGFGASPGAIGRVLEEEGWVIEEARTRPHPPKVRRFERSRPNELWQTDLFTFTLKRENRRVHLVGFMDDATRFIVGFGLHASASGALVREVFEAAVSNFGAPEEVLTDNGSQYHTWRGKSAFKKLLERRGIRQIVASPRRPQTLGKIERFWGTLWRDFLEAAIFRGLDDARRRIGHFIDYYNFQRTHRSLDGLVPADRYFEAAPEVRSTLSARVSQNALELARNGEPRKPFYLTGRVGTQAISLHAEGEKVVLVNEDGTREEVDLGAPGRRVNDVEVAPLARDAAPEDLSSTADEATLAPPCSSELDSLLDDLAAGLDGDASEDDEEGVSS